MTSGKEIQNQNAEQTLPWLIQFLETAEDAELALLLKNLDCCTSADRAILDVVTKFQAMSRRDILDSYADPAELKQAEAISGLRELRWLRIKHALRALRPANETLEPEAQLSDLQRNAKRENLLDFVLRYRRMADSFLRQGVITKARCMQILYQKLPIDLQKSMWTMPFGSASLDLIEDVVRNRMNWLAIIAKGAYTAEEIGGYIATDDLEPYIIVKKKNEDCKEGGDKDKVDAKGGEKFDVKGSSMTNKADVKRPKKSDAKKFDKADDAKEFHPTVIGGMSFDEAVPKMLDSLDLVEEVEEPHDKLMDAEILMMKWKELMHQPRYRRQAEKFLGIRKDIAHCDSAVALHGDDRDFVATLRGDEGVGRERESDTPPPAPSRPPTLSRKAYKPLPPIAPRVATSRRYLL